MSYKILYVASEINPFLQTTEVAEFVRQLPQAMQERGMEIRILVPRFGLINERKNRLHEVVRLSGINISVGDRKNLLLSRLPLFLTLSCRFTSSTMKITSIGNQYFLINKITFTKTMTKGLFSFVKAC